MHIHRTCIYNHECNMISICDIFTTFMYILLLQEGYIVYQTMIFRMDRILNPVSFQTFYMHTT